VISRGNRTRRSGRSSSNVSGNIIIIIIDATIVSCLVSGGDGRRIPVCRQKRLYWWYHPACWKGQWQSYYDTAACRCQFTFPPGIKKPHPTILSTTVLCPAFQSRSSSSTVAVRRQRRPSGKLMTAMVTSRYLQMQGVLPETRADGGQDANSVVSIAILDVLAAASFVAYLLHCHKGKAQCKGRRVCTSRHVFHAVRYFEPFSILYHGLCCRNMI
jgi:hypothetical protein